MRYLIAPVTASSGPRTWLHRRQVVKVLEKPDEFAATGLGIPILL